MNDLDMKSHWNIIYEKTEKEKLGWYEGISKPSMDMINKTDLKKNDKIFIAGAGATNLIDWLINKGYSNIFVNDISEIAIKKLQNKYRLNKNIHFITDDLTVPTILKNVKNVRLWHDRAVLHFFTNKYQQRSYFQLVNSMVEPGGFVIIGVFSKQGVNMCSGLPVIKYSIEMIKNGLGNKFELISSFNYTHRTPSGEDRPYIYSLFKK